VEWIHMAQDRDRWRVVVNAVMNLQFLAPKRVIMNNKLTLLMCSVLVLRLYIYGKVTTGVILATYPIFVNNYYLLCVL
jgi:hypothetical protein